MRSSNMRRTRSLAIVVATCLLCLARPIICDADTENGKNPGNGQQPKTPPEKPVVAESPKSDVDKSNKNNNNNNNTAAAAAPVDNTIAKSGKEVLTSNQKPPAVVKGNKNDVPVTENISKSPEQSGIGHTTSLNSGAFVRGFYVFVGLSVLALAYMVFRSFRLNKSRTQMVRKYGVLAHKQDIEMRPLPLDEDDDDDTTVFDASGLSHQPLRSQS